LKKFQLDLQKQIFIFEILLIIKVSAIVVGKLFPFYFRFESKSKSKKIKRGKEQTRFWSKSLSVTTTTTTTTIILSPIQKIVYEKICGR
jgi:hypothetical protein